MTNPPKLTSNVSHKVSLVSFQTTSFFPNVTETNNKVYYRNASDTVDKVVTVDTGGYSIEDYYDAISTAIAANNDDPKNIYIELVKASGKVRITLKSGYKVFFNKDCTWRDALGFTAINLVRDNVYTSAKVAHVVTTEKVYAKCNLCSDTLFNGETTSILFSFPNSKRYGSLLNVNPNPLIPRKLVNTHIDKVRLEFIDEAGSPVSFPRSNICMTILIEQM